MKLDLSLKNKQVMLSTLHIGSCFLKNGQYLIKSNEHFEGVRPNFYVVDLQNGELKSFCGNTLVTPIALKVVYDEN